MNSSHGWPPPPHLHSRWPAYIRWPCRQDRWLVLTPTHWWSLCKARAHLGSVAKYRHAVLLLQKSRPAVCELCRYAPHSPTPTIAMQPHALHASSKDTRPLPVDCAVRQQTPGHQGTSFPHTQSLSVGALAAVAKAPLHDCLIGICLYRCSVDLTAEVSQA